MQGTVRRAEIQLHCAVTYQVSVFILLRISMYCRSAGRYIRQGALLSQLLVNTSEHTAAGGSSSRMSEPVFFHTVDNRTPSAYRFILHDKTAFIQLCVNACLLQELRTALHTVSCITGAVIINSMNTLWLPPPPATKSAIAAICTLVTVKLLTQN